MKNLNFFKGMAVMAFILSLMSFGPTLINLVELAKPGGNNEVLETNATGVVAWTAKNSLFSGGTDVEVLADGTINNLASDQVVALTESGAANVTGTYPNFNIDVTEADGSETNESQGFGAGGTTNITLTVDPAGGAGGGTVTLIPAGGISFSRAGDDVTISSTTSSAPTVNNTSYEEEMASSINTVTVSGFTPDEVSTFVWVDGVKMRIGAGKDATLSGSTYTFASPLAVGQVFEAVKTNLQ